MAAAAIKIRVASAAFAAMIVSSPAVLSINPLLMVPMGDEFGWGRSTLAAGYMVAAPVMAVMYLLVGPAVDRFGVRRIVIPGFLLFAAALSTMAMLSGSILQFLLLKGLIAATAALVTGIAFGKVVSSHFAGNRGLFLGLCLGGGGGLGMMVLPLIGNLLFAGLGWRGTYLGMALIVLVVGLPAALALPTEPRPHPDGMVPQAGQPPVRAVGMLRDGTFQLLLISTFLAYSVVNGIFAHLAAIIGDAGLSVATGALALALYAASATCGQFLIGPILDRSASPRIGLAAFAAVLVGIGLIGLGDDEPMLLMGAVFIGFGSGCESGLLPCVLPRYFGLASFGTLYAWIYAAAAIGTGIGPYGMGLVFDHTHSYGSALITCGAAVLVLLAIFCVLPRYFRAADGTNKPAADPVSLPVLVTARREAV